MSDNAMPGITLAEFETQLRQKLPLLEKSLECFEEDKGLAHLEAFHHEIKHLRKLAVLLSLDFVAKFCEMGASIAKHVLAGCPPELSATAAAVLLDQIELLKKIASNLKSGKEIDNKATQAFATRLKWLVQKLKQTPGDSGGASEKDHELDVLLKELGFV